MLCRRICLFVHLSTRSVLTFTEPSQEDLGLYTVEMSDNPYLSSSYDFTAEGKINLVEMCESSKLKERENCLVQFTTLA